MTDDRNLWQVQTKRVADLKPGERFKWMGLKWVVASITDRIYFCNERFGVKKDSNGSRCNYKSFGKHSHMIVELITERP